MVYGERKGGHMKTVKEVSELTGVSIRTLRYYDEIDLLKPAKVTEAGYRLYDENSLKNCVRFCFSGTGSFAFRNQSDHERL